MTAIWMFLSNFGNLLSILAAIICVITFFTGMHAKSEMDDYQPGGEKWVMYRDTVRKSVVIFLVAGIIGAIGISVPRPDYQKETIEKVVEKEVPTKFSEMYEKCMNNYSDGDTEQSAKCNASVNATIAAEKASSGIPVKIVERPAKIVYKKIPYAEYLSTCMGSKATEGGWNMDQTKEEMAVSGKTAVQLRTERIAVCNASIGNELRGLIQ